MSARAVGDRDIGVAGPPQAIIASASPMTYTNNSPHAEGIYITVPAGVTATVARAGVTLLSLLTPAATTVGAFFLVPAGGAIVLAYSAGAPVLVRDVA